MLNSAVHRTSLRVVLSSHQVPGLTIVKMVHQIPQLNSVEAVGRIIKILTEISGIAALLQGSMQTYKQVAGIVFLYVLRKINEIFLANRASIEDLNIFPAPDRFDKQLENRAGIGRRELFGV